MAAVLETGLAAEQDSMQSAEHVQIVAGLMTRPG